MAHIRVHRPAWQLPLALIAAALVALSAVGVVAIRVVDATAHNALNLPLLLLPGAAGSA